MLPHTKKPNAIVTFETVERSASIRNSGLGRVIEVGDVDEVEDKFVAGVYINPVSYADIRVRAIVPSTLNEAEGEVWLGGWRLSGRTVVPDWILNDISCSVQFIKKRGHAASARFFYTLNRKDFGDTYGVGPEIGFQLLTKVS